MRRRDFIACLLLGATMRHAQAQQRAKVYRITIVSPTTFVTDMNEMGGDPVYQPLFQELRRLGYRVIVVWECETRKPTSLARRLERLLVPRT